MTALDLRDRIRDVPDFPTEGIVFKDLMPLIADPEYFAETIHQLADWARPREPALILGAEARGFIFGAALAYRRVRALYSPAHPLHVRVPGDFTRQDGAVGDARFVEFSVRRLPRTRTEPDTPSSFDPYGDI